MFVPGPGAMIRGQPAKIYQSGGSRPGRPHGWGRRGTTRGARRTMIITLVIDTFNVGNNGTTVSAMRFAATLMSRGHTVRVVACGEPGDATGQGVRGP